MKCKIRNISGGLITVPEFSLNTNAETVVEFTEKIRYYVAVGYIKMLDFVYEPAMGYTFSQKKVEHIQQKPKIKKVIGG